MRACPRCLSTYREAVEFCGIDGTALVEVETDPLLGRQIDRYRVIEALGRGAMGTVYRGTHVLLGRDFALKVLHGSYAANRTLVARFHREALALSKVRHTNIVSVVDFVTTEVGLSALVMDYLPGRTLADVIAEGPLAPERAAKIARQIALGLAAAHAHGIVHRDVKPSNVLLVPEGAEEVAKLVDFGVVAVDEPADAPRLTALGKILGTPTYMAPEQATADGLVTRRSDLYALGVILFEMLSGRPPFGGKSIAEVLLQHLGAPVPELLPAGGLEVLTAALLEKDPELRPIDGTAVAAELSRLLDGGALTGLSAGPTIPLERTTSTPPLARAPSNAPLARASSNAPLARASSNAPLARASSNAPLALDAAHVATLAPQLGREPAPVDTSPGLASPHLAPPRGSLVAPIAMTLAALGVLGALVFAAEPWRPAPGEILTTPLAEPEPEPPRPLVLPQAARTATGAEGAAAGTASTSASAAEDRGERARPSEPEVDARTGPPAGGQAAAETPLPAGAGSQAAARARRTRPTPKLSAPASTVVTRAALEKRLDRVLLVLRGATREIPANLLQQQDDRYLALRAALSDAKSDEDLQSVARRLTKLETDLDNLRKGR